MANAARQLRVAQDELREIGSLIYVCTEALRAKIGDDVGPDVATVLSLAYGKLVLDVNKNVRDALNALGQDGGK